MVKAISLLKRKEGMSLDEFRTWATQEHPELAKKLPGIRGYRMNVVLADNPDLPFDAVSESWFDSTEALDAAFGGDAGRQAGADAAAHCSARVRLVTDETVVLS